MVSYLELNVSIVPQVQYNAFVDTVAVHFMCQSIDRDTFIPKETINSEIK